MVAADSAIEELGADTFITANMLDQDASQNVIYSTQFGDSETYTIECENKTMNEFGDF